MNRPITARITAGREQMLFWVLVAATVAMLALYIYFISASVINIVLRKEMLLEISAAHSRIGDLEAQYLAITNTIDANYAEAEGFAFVDSPVYVSRSDAGSLTLNR